MVTDRHQHEPMIRQGFAGLAPATSILGWLVNRYLYFLSREGGMLNNRDLFDGKPLALDADLAALPLELERIWPKLLVDMLDVARAALMDAGAREGRARDIAIIVLRALARYHGGRSAYLPTGDTLEDALKHYRIWHESGKTSVRELSEKYGLSEVHIYRIVARQRNLVRARAQGAATQAPQSAS